MPSVFCGSLKGSISKQILSIRSHRSKVLYARRNPLGGRLDKNCFLGLHFDANSFGNNYGDTGSHSLQQHYRLHFIQ